MVGMRALGHGVDPPPTLKSASLPALELEGADGERIVVAPRALDDRVRELAAALAGRDRALPFGAVIDGRPVPADVTLAASGIRRGSRVSAIVERPLCAEAGASADTVREPRVAVTCIAGPAAGPSVPLPAGRHVVGRARDAAVRVADDMVEPHHAIVDVGDDGSVTFTQLTGRVPCRVDGRRVSGRTELRPGDAVLLGASRIVVGRPPAGGDTEAGATLAVRPDDPWRRSVVRTPRPIPSWAPTPVVVPAAAGGRARAGGIGLVSALAGAAGTAVVAVVLDQPMFLVLGLVGLLVAGGSWIAAHVGTVRAGRRASTRRRRDVATFAAAVAEQAAARAQFHRTVTPTTSDALAAAASHGAPLWARRPEHGDAFTVSLGWGDVRWQPAVDDDGTGDTELAAILAHVEHLPDVPVPTDLGPGAAIAVVGPHAAAVIRSLIMQLAVWTGPADWRLVVLADDPRAWRWCAWLPHTLVAGDTLVVDANRPEAVAHAIARVDDGDPRHVVIVSDRPDLLTARTGSVRRFVGAAASAAVVVHAMGLDEVPAICRRVLEVGSLGVARWTADTATLLAPDHVHVAGISLGSAGSAVRQLASLVDPEDPNTAASSLAAVVTLGALAELHGAGPLDDAIAVAAAWRSAGADPAPAAVIGLTVDGVVELDLVRDGPHALIAGTTGSGKSELLRTLVVSLAARSSPDHLAFVLIDYKGGSTFDACADLPHTVGVVTDLDDRLAERALVSLGAELRRREQLLRECGAADLVAYRAAADRPPLPRLVVVVDEFAALAAELPGFLTALVGIAQRGRSLGVHLVLATQRPAGVVSDEIRANTNLRVALRLQDAGEARDIVGDGSPATFARGTPGRAMMRLGPGETVQFQSARSSAPMVPRGEDRLRIVAGELPVGQDGVSELIVLVRAIRHAAALCDIGRSHRPWLPPLPEDLDPALLERGAVGLVDQPSAQRRVALRWSPADGNLALIGARGMGTTTALRSVLAAVTHERSADDVHVYVVDSAGGTVLDELGDLPHCAAVVRLHERERLRRVLRRLAAELDARRRAAAERPRPHVVLAVDGMPALRSALDGVATAADLELLTRLFAEGPGVGIVGMLTAERPGALAATLLAACAERWVFHLDDPLERVAAGVSAAAVPPAIPGRLVVASSGFEAQLAALPLPVEPATGGPSPIDVLPDDVDARRLPSSCSRQSGALELVIGVEFETLQPARLVVVDGEHILVAGPARSGRSTALARLAAAWSDACPDGEICVLGTTGARAAGGTIAGTRRVESAGEVEDGDERPRLLLIDDAERVDDPGGSLAALAASRRQGVLVAAAGRPESLRPMYGHWTAIVRRSRLGLLLSACAETDGDLLGELLPRHPPLPPRSGLAWLIGSGPRALVQIARNSLDFKSS
jgi:S-DNA-T family DNA segregation ATPase FtsK/SpoIIIE